ncbi:MAG TPA: ABC transporter permease [Nitrososphaerales archaeon]|nr:ABC transporter permease [Nitrososphaerales archaeon]
MSDSTLKKFLRNGWTVRVISLVIFLIGWQIFASSVNPLIFVPPSVVAKRFLQLWFTGGLPIQTLITLETVFVSLAISALIGIPIGLAMGTRKIVEYGIDPYVNFIYSLPVVVIIPLAVIWFGSDLWPSTYIIVFLHAVPPILINTMIGVKAMNRTLSETGRSFGLRGIGLLRKIIVPGSLPYILAGLRIGVGLAIIGTMVVEIFLYNTGLGYELVFFQNRFDTAAVIVGILVIMAIGIGCREVIRFLEKRALAWSVGATGVA